MAVTPGELVQKRHDVGSSSFRRLLDVPGNRLHGEDPSSSSLDDARHWTDAYDRLISFKRKLLDRYERHAEKSGPEAARSVRETDVIMLEVQLSRFQQRRDYWKLRATELAGDGRRGASG